ncbi:hypothetical protein [Billgrantia montanilacus]|nr:hypothetical protein [Halomonas montanilacus]
MDSVDIEADMKGMERAGRMSCPQNKTGREGYLFGDVQSHPTLES